MHVLYEPQKSSYEFGMTCVNVIIRRIIHLGYCRPANRSNLPSCFCQATVLFEEERGELGAFLSGGSVRQLLLLFPVCLFGLVPPPVVCLLL